jgi:hypothetical protein
MSCGVEFSVCNGKAWEKVPYLLAYFLPGLFIRCQVSCLVQAVKLFEAGEHNALSV